MMRRHTTLGGACAVIAMILSAAPTPVRASGFLVARFGGQEGNPTTEDPAAIYFDPAGIAMGHGTRVEAEGIIADRGLSYDRPVEAIDHVIPAGGMGAGTPQDAVAANSGKASLSNLIAAPFIAVISDLGGKVPNLTVGAALFAPFGGSANWNKNDAFASSTQYPGAVDGVQRWSIISGSLQALYLTGAAAVRIPVAHLSFGVALNVVRTAIDTLRARNPNGGDDLVTSTGAIQEGRSLLSASGTTFSIGAGVMWRPIDHLVFGVSYQSQPGFGTMRLTGTLTNKFGAGPVDKSDVVLEQALPDVWRAGVRWIEGPMQIFASIDWVRWSVFQHQCLMSAGNSGCALNADGSPAPGVMGIVVNNERHWQDTGGVRMGMSYRVRRWLLIDGGWGYDGNAVPDSTIDASLIDMSKLDIGVGAVFTVLDGKLDVIADATQFVFFDRTVAARARDASGEPFLQSPSRTPDGAGTYKQSVTAVTLGLRYRF
jgi:long-chain fatty acid transport protein